MGMQYQGGTKKPVEGRRFGDALAARLGERLKATRLARGLTQSQLAGEHFSLSYISAVEHGRIRPSLDGLEWLAARLDISMLDLLGRSEIPHTGMDEGVTQVQHLAGETSVHEEIEAHVREAQILTMRGDGETAVEMLLRARPKALSARERALIQVYVAGAYIALGRGDEALRAAREALPHTEHIGDGELTGRLCDVLAQAHALLGDHRHALALYQQCLSALACQDARDGRDVAGKQLYRDPMEAAGILYGIGTEYASLGDTERAIAHLQQAVQLISEGARPQRLGALFWRQSQAYAGEGEPVRARAYAWRSLAAYEEAGMHRLVARAYTQLSQALVSSGQTDAALAQVRQASEIAAGQRDDWCLAEAQRGLALVYLAEKRADDAAAAAREAVAHADAADDRVQRAQALLVLARAQEELGHISAADASFNEALAALDTLHVTPSAHGTGARRVGMAVPRERDASRDAHEAYSEFLERRGDSVKALEMLKRAI